MEKYSNRAKGGNESMQNIIAYVKNYGNYTFAEKPLNEVDSLVLCQMSYMNFKPFVQGFAEQEPAVSIRSIAESDRVLELLEGYWYKQENEELFYAVADSPRFQNMKMNFHVNVIKTEQETQFSAITFLLDEQIVYVAYRGTDATIVGWKEDLNLALSKPTHSQELAVQYIEQVSSKLACGFYMGGHSKGGNLASYAAMNCSPGVRDRIIRIFNHDGPGFRPEIFEMGHYEEVSDRMIKFIPKSSIVGVIMETSQNCEIIESHSIGAMQHNSYNWRVEEDHFVRLLDRSALKKLQDEALNEWIMTLSQEQLHTFVDTLYEVICASGAADVFQFGGDLKGSIARSYEALKDMDEETRRAVHTILHTLYEIAGDKFHQEFVEKWAELQHKVVQKKEKITRNAKNVAENVAEKTKRVDNRDKIR